MSDGQIFRTKNINNKLSRFIVIYIGLNFFKNLNFWNTLETQIQYGELIKGVRFWYRRNFGHCRHELVKSKNTY